MSIRFMYVFYGLVVNFMFIWYFLWSIGKLFPILVCCTKKNMATLILVLLP
jgi:hypothetical protein